MGAVLAAIKLSSGECRLGPAPESRSRWAYHQCPAQLHAMAQCSVHRRANGDCAEAIDEATSSSDCSFGVRASRAGGPLLHVPRLLLQKCEVSRQYEVERFNNVTDACNFYGASQPLCTLATEFFSGVTGPVGDLLLVTRFPSESTRSCGRCNETSRDR